MSAILRRPSRRVLLKPTACIAPGLEQIVQHCLEKNLEERFQLAHGIAFDLHIVFSPSSLGKPRSRSPD